MYKRKLSTGLALGEVYARVQPHLLARKDQPTPTDD